VNQIAKDSDVDQLVPNFLALANLAKRLLKSLADIIRIHYMGEMLNSARNFGWQRSHVGGSLNLKVKTACFLPRDSQPHLKFIAYAGLFIDHLDRYHPPAHRRIYHMIHIAVLITYYGFESLFNLHTLCRIFAVLTVESHRELVIIVLVIYMLHRDQKLAPRSWQTLRI